MSVVTPAAALSQTAISIAPALLDALLDVSVALRRSREAQTELREQLWKLAVAVQVLLDAQETS